MNETKPWYLSTGVWASLVQIIVSLAVTFGIIDSVSGSTIVEQTPGLIVSIVTALAGFFSLYGRVSATKEITATNQNK